MAVDPTNHDGQTPSTARNQPGHQAPTSTARNQPGHAPTSKPRNQHEPYGPGETVLVTGATGFVGGQLLVRLLEREPDVTVICPVRADHAAGALERGIDQLRTLLGRTPTADEVARTRWVRADLEQRQLGWDDETYASVIERLVEVFHCAASVSFDLDIDDAHRINVEGSINAYEVAEAARKHHHGFRRFHHVSTAYVSGLTAGRVDANHIPDDRAKNYRNTYERTKARAERCLRRRAIARPDAVPVSIYRPSIIAGNTTDGVTNNWNVLYVPMKMVVRGQLPVFPKGGRALVDTIGVDFLTDAMLELRRYDDKAVLAYHITAGSTAFDIGTLMGTTTRRASQHSQYKPSVTRLVNHATWNAMTKGFRGASKAPKQLRSIRRMGKLGVRGTSACAVYLPYTKVATIFDAGREHDLLRWAGITMPDGQTFLNTVVDYALDTDFGRNLSGPTDVADPSEHVNLRTAEPAATGIDTDPATRGPVAPAIDTEPAAA